MRTRRSALLACSITVALTLAGEALVRTLGRSVVYEPDELLGWRPKANFSARVKAIDQTGECYDADYTTGPYGFRAFGDTTTRRTRVLFVGDSFTGDPDTSNDEAYFGVVRERLPAEVFAIGASGYGTFQELLLVEQIVGAVAPDVFALQYCTNDVSDNSFELEGRMSHVRNQKNLRPYLVDESVVYRLGAAHPYRLLYEHSRLFRNLDVTAMKLQYRFGGSSKPSGDDAAWVAAERTRAIALTRELLAKLARAMPEDARSLTFSCDTSSPEDTETWKTMAAGAGFDVYPSVSEAIEAAENGGETVRIRDGVHWNRRGHRIAGEELARILGEQYLGHP